MVDYVEVPSTNYAGVAWDAFGGAPDPTVNLYAGTSDAVDGTLNLPDDVFAGSPRTVIASNLRASDILAYLAFGVFDEDVSDFEFIGACYVSGVGSSTFSGGAVSVDCPPDAGREASGFALDFHLEPY